MCSSPLPGGYQSCLRVFLALCKFGLRAPAAWHKAGNSLMHEFILHECMRHWAGDVVRKSAHSELTPFLLIVFFFSFFFSFY